MGTEHTWCFMDPGKQPISNDILKVKFGFFREAEDRSNSLLNFTLAPVTDDESSITGVFNTLSWPRSGLVSIPARQSINFNSICDENGKTILSQRLSTGELIFLAADIPPLASKKYFLKKKEK